MKLIPLKKRDGTVVAHAIVDDDIFDYLSQWTWRYQNAGHGYAGRGEGRRMVLMHRVIMNAPEGVEVDHRDNDGLNCQRHNLRLATHAQNMCNRLKNRRGTSQYKGVFWTPGIQKWRVMVYSNYKQIRLGCFADELEAARAYDAKAKELHGDFARLNFPEQS